MLPGALQAVTQDIQQQQQRTDRVARKSIPSSCVGVEKWKIDSVAINAQKHYC